MRVACCVKKRFLLAELFLLDGLRRFQKKCTERLPGRGDRLFGIPSFWNPFQDDGYPQWMVHSLDWPYIS
jgi:hypothetical protein